MKRQKANAAASTGHPDQYLSVDETAERLGCAPKTVRNKISLGLIRPQHGLRHFGRRVLFDWQVLKAAIDAGESFDPRPKKEIDDAI